MIIKKNNIITFLISLFIIVVAFFPKLNLFDIPGSSTGIRIEDLLIALIIIMLFPKKIKEINKDVNIKEILKCFLIYIGVCLISTIWGVINNYIGVLGGALYFLRKIEYFVAIYFGYYYYKNNRKDYSKINIFLDFIIIFHFIFVLLQYFGLVGSFHAGDIMSTLTQNRVSSTFNGAYELSGFLLLLVPFYVYSIFKLNKYKISNIVFLLLIFFIIFISQSRISLLTFIILVLLMFYKLSNNKRKKMFVFGLPIILVLGLIAINFGNSKISDRLKSVSFSNSINATVCAWQYKSFDVYKKYGYWYTNMNCMNIGNDYSWNLRVNHWMQLIDGLLRSPLFGTGLSVTGSAADGEFVRILSESGFIGLICFVLLIKKILDLLNKHRNNKYLYISKYILISMLIGSIFIDIFSASKISMIFWLFIGYSFASLGDKNEKSDNSK